VTGSRGSLQVQRRPAQRRRAVLLLIVATALWGCGGGATTPTGSPGPTARGAEATTAIDLYRAERPGALPAAGTPVVAGIQLPAGRPLTPDPAYRSGRLLTQPVPALWVTDDVVPGVGRLWERLAAAFPETGLWPVILDPLEEDPTRPWTNGELDPIGSGDPAALDAAAVLTKAWSEAVPSDPAELGQPREELAPFGAAFPGLAPASSSTPRADAVATLAAGLPGRLGLVPVTRPADVPAAIGWLGPANYFTDVAPLSAVLRSWEDRFGAVLVGLGFATMHVAVRRPPVGESSTLAVAAEHLAICPDNIFQGIGNVRDYASSLDGEAAWFFWWD